MGAVAGLERLTADDRALARRIDSALALFSEVSFGYLFGSRAQARARQDSDVDLALALTPEGALRPLFERLERLAPGLMLVAGDRLDLVFLDVAPPLLAHRILRDGILVHEKDPVSRVRFHVRMVSTYLDTRFLREVQISATVRRALEGRTIGRSRDPREALAFLGRARGGP